MKRILGVIAACTILLGPMALVGPARAVVPGANGRIVFARATWAAGAYTYQIVAADPNGANQTILAGPYARDVFDDHFIANWSPDGSTVIFMADLDGTQKIWQVGADGTGLHALFAAPADTGLDDGPTFTPDGQHIVFTRCCPEGFGYSLWMINADGSGLTNVTKEPPTTPDGDGPAETSPQVSPNGKKIAFNRCFPDQPCVIATVRIDGSHLRQLTDNTLFEGTHPNWSPDSRRITFQYHYFGGGADIALMKADGSDLQLLTSDGEGGHNGNMSPCFSPDGSKIAFSHFLSTGGVDLYTMNADGSGVTQVTRTGQSLELDPEWARAGG
jgi:Tol biopolymer transport system component